MNVYLIVILFYLCILGSGTFWGCRVSQSLSKARSGISCSCYCVTLLFLRFRKSSKRWNPTSTPTPRCSPLCCTKRKQRFLVRKTRSPFLWSWFGDTWSSSRSSSRRSTWDSSTSRKRWVSPIAAGHRRTSRGLLRRWVLMCVVCSSDHKVPTNGAFGSSTHGSYKQLSM